MPRSVAAGGVAAAGAAAGRVPPVAARARSAINAPKLRMASARAYRKSIQDSLKCALLRFERGGKTMFRNSVARYPTFFAATRDPAPTCPNP